MNNNNENINSNNSNNNSNNNTRSPILMYQNYQINIIVVGNRGVGKSELLNRYCENTGISNKRINSEIKLKRIVRNDKYIRFRFYDVGEFYKELNSYLGAIFVYDTTNYQSFENIKEYYYQLHYLNNRKSNIYIINNKNTNDQYEEDYDNYLINNNSNSNSNMDELFFKVFRNLYLRNLIYSFKKKDIIIKYLIGTKLDLKNNPVINNISSSNNSINSDSEDEIEINYSKSTTKHNYNNNNQTSSSSSSSSSSTNKHVTTEEAKEFANKMGAKFYEVSSIENPHIINQIFNELTDSVINNYELYSQNLILENIKNNIITHYHQDGSRSTIINNNNNISSQPPSLSAVNKNRNNLSSVYWKRKCTLN